jgi:hypothetical protein
MLKLNYISIINIDEVLNAQDRIFSGLSICNYINSKRLKR